MSARHVRVIIDGDAREVGGAVLRVFYGANMSTLVDTSMAAVTVEDVAPPRSWTPGDVVAGDATVYMRDRDGMWRGVCSSGFPLTAVDQDMTKATDPGQGADAMTVLRYQAGGDA